jgi:hypothetical protein
MPNPVEGNSLVLKVFNESAFQVLIQVILEKDVQRFYDDRTVWRFWRRKDIPSDKDLSVASAAKLIDDIIALIQQAVI